MQMIASDFTPHFVFLFIGELDVHQIHGLNSAVIQAIQREILDRLFLILGCIHILGLERLILVLVVLLTALIVPSSSFSSC